MKRIIIILVVLAFSVGVVYAQEQDSIKKEVPSIEIAPVESETPELDVPEGLGEPIFKIEVEEEVEIKKENNTPRIIYYETNPNQSQEKNQNPNHSSDIKTLSGSMNHSGGFGAISFRYSDFRYETIMMAGMRAGWIVNRTLGIGFEGHGIIPTTKYTDVDPDRDAVLLGGYGGMFLELIFFSNQVIHVTFPVSAGAGWLGYNQHWESNLTNPSPSGGIDPLIDGDTFWYAEPGANLELNVSRNFRMCFGVSRRFTQDLELINSNERAFEKTNFFLTLKFGKF